ncbi:MAG: hypothetical protein ACHP79_05905, partial [Terriglobales bacterium]
MLQGVVLRLQIFSKILYLAPRCPQTCELVLQPDPDSDLSGKVRGRQINRRALGRRQRAFSQEVFI